MSAVGMEGEAVIARRLVLALLIAITISGVFTFWLSRRFARPHNSSSPRLQYVATGRKMEAGEILKPADLKQIDWPNSSPLEGSFFRQADVTGRTLLYPLAAGEPILDRQLSAPGMGSGLSIRIPDGMRALSLKSDQVVGVAGFLLPGTHVDVLVTYHTPMSSDPVTATVLQDAEILAAGQKMQPDPEGKAATVDVVTILVSPQDAEKAVLASAQGTVHFVLRNGSDHDRVSNSPIQLSSLDPAFGSKPNVKPAAVRVRTSVEPKPYTVEVLRGDKQTVETFQ
jgi:pilus assembly protein CpaB